MNRTRSMLRSVISLIALLAISCSNLKKTEPVSGYGITAQNGMVVSAHPLASEIGTRTLMEGGNAIDAAVSTGFALAVCYPNAGNIGGGGLMVIRMGDGTVASLDFREAAPAAASRDMYLDGSGEVIEDLSTSSHLAAGVPGSVAGLCEAHQRYGRLTFRHVIQPAIDMAMNGFPVTAAQAASLNRTMKIFEERNDIPTAFQSRDEWREGDTLRQPELAATLERIQGGGPDGFYKGTTADLIVGEMADGNGLITHADLENYRAVWREALKSDYKDYTIISMPPPSSGGVALIQLFRILEDFPVKEMGFLNPTSIHLIAEAERRVYADRAEYLGDPDFIDIPVKGLVDREYLKGRMADFKPGTSSLSSEIGAGNPLPYESDETTHYSITDRDGNAVSVTTTLNAGYGNCIVVDGAGFLLNNEMDDFSVKPGYPNIYGLVGGEANSIQPGKRMLSSMTPTIVEKNGKLHMVVGSPGGSTIITSVFQVMLNVMEYGMDMQDAVDAPRFHHQWLPDMISYETGRLDSTLIEELELMGHKLVARGSIGRVDAIRLTPEGRYEGGADRRGDDMASGY